MSIVIIFISVFLVKLVLAQFGITYNLFSDVFNLRLAILDFVLFVSVYASLSFIYRKVKRLSLRKY
ncbi:hypothetical protein [Vibrio bivalvicida]|uniref:Uncharacterized protein n=1 Tax=Vibrio bivalvicida TaxID=1276888 RepID=A0A177Y0Q4_9VIBR|nr:hypothetical protein [Vibrio bivalvicida]OAJ94410.1 hypothetical protein APB76_09525 [Vibrio bivalvicida]